jgi:hypothetical protein
MVLIQDHGCSKTLHRTHGRIFGHLIPSRGFKGFFLNNERRML